MAGEDEIHFLCDAMLGGLARWLRAAGYDARFDPHVPDGELVRLAYEGGGVLVTSDSGILERYAVARGLVRHVFVPLGLTPVEQLGHVLGRLGMPLREPRCMECGGELTPVGLGDVIEHVPAKVPEVCKDYFRCERCAKVYWRGTHWQSILRQLGRAQALAAREGRRPGDP